MITLSLCIIVKNEEKVIKRCLDSIYDIMDEIIIVDTGSTDKTVEIAKQYTNKIYTFPWVNDFSAARNFSFSKATCDYILWLDADDVIKEEDKLKLYKLKQTLDLTYDGVSMRYHYAFNDKGDPTLIFRRNRIVKKEKNFKWVGFIHEYLDAHGRILDSDINVSHMRVHSNSDRNLKIFKEKIKSGYNLNSRDTFYYGRELYYNGLYDEAIHVFNKVLNMDGWIEEKIQALISLSDIYLSKGMYVKCRSCCYESFHYEIPRAEILYRIAFSYEMEKKYKEAVSWYEIILHLEIPKEGSGFIYTEYWTWMPHLQLSVCYYNLGNTQKSFEHHQLAYEYNPYDPIILRNKEFFDSVKIL